MYYLEDQHEQFEYAIYIKIKQGTPFITGRYTDEKQVAEHIRSMARRHDQYHQPYYVDCESFDNTYPPGIPGTYYKVLKRAVNDWTAVK